MEFEWNGSGKFGAVTFRVKDMPEIKNGSTITLSKLFNKVFIKRLV
jgi:hypothetical protein